MITLTEENYLKAIYHLTLEKNQVSVNELSKYLKIKMPSVNSMMKKFAAKNWVIYESYKPLRMTAEGHLFASQVVRKHRLTEMFLTEKMGFGWDQVHEIAEEVEHIKSDIFFDRIDKILGYPKTDPHGSPIPDKNGNIFNQNLQKLSDCNIGDKMKFTALAESSAEFLKFLNKQALPLNTDLVVISVEDFDGSMVIGYNNRQETFSKMVCEKILVNNQDAEKAIK